VNSVALASCLYHGGHGEHGVVLFSVVGQFEIVGGGKNQRCRDWPGWLRPI
jgi:hypothetical protein